MNMFDKLWTVGKAFKKDAFKSHIFAFSIAAELSLKCWDEALQLNWVWNVGMKFEHFGKFGRVDIGILFGQVSNIEGKKRWLNSIDRWLNFS